MKHYQPNVAQPVQKKSVSAPSFADARGTSLHENTSNQTPIQLRKYVRALSDEGGFDYEVEQLTKESPIDSNTNMTGEHMNTWLKGRSSVSTAHYNEGQLHYYSPVGFILDVDEENRVLGNFAGDGNTGSLHQYAPEYHAAVDAMRLAIGALDDISDELARVEGAPAAFDATIDSQPKAALLLTKIHGLLNHEHVPGGIKSSIRTIMKDEARKGLVARFKNDEANKYPLGPGLDPDGLNELQESIVEADGQVFKNPDQNDRETKYTEAQLNVEISQVECAYYNTDKGAYPGNITADWRTDEEWATKRRSSANKLKGKFTNAGGGGHVTLKEIKDGKIQ